MVEPSVTCDNAGVVVTLTLTRESKRNALSIALQHELTEHLEAVKGSSSVRAVVLRAAGPVFSAGHDFVDSGRNTTQEEHEAFEYVTIALIDLMHRLPQPIIGVTDGLAAAAGLELLLSCDMIVATSRAMFSTPGVTKGMWCSTPMVPLTRSISPHPAFEMLCLGEAIDARRAYELGMVNRVVEPADLDNCLSMIVDRIAANSPAAIWMGKQAFYRQQNLPVDQAWSITAETVGKNALHPDAAEGTAAFFAGRPPAWSPLDPAVADD